MKKLLVVLLLLNSTAFADIKSDAVAAHNKWRNALNNGQLENQPRPAPFLQDMIWSEAKAKSAKAHSERCVWEHSGSGENLYTGTGGYGSVEHAVNLWAEEYENYDYNKNTSTGGQIGHYTQVVWDTSTKVGCGIAYCDPVRRSDGSRMWSGTIITCQYSGPGNWVGHKPYKTSGYKNDFVTYNSENRDVEIPTIVLAGKMYRLKLSMLPVINNKYDFDFDAWEYLYDTKRTDTSFFFFENGKYHMVLVFDGVKVKLTQVDPKKLIFRYIGEYK